MSDINDSRPKQSEKIVVVSPQQLAEEMHSRQRPEIRPALKPVTQPLAVSKKAYQIDYDGGALAFRPRVPFDPVVHKGFAPEQMFHQVWESTNFYDLFLPDGEKYIEMSFFGQDNALPSAISQYEKIGKLGFRNVNEKMLIGPHRVLFGDYDRDDGGDALLVPISSPVKNLKDLGLTITINDEPDKPKVRKYMRRIHAHHTWAVPGTVVGSRAMPTGSVVTVDCGGLTFDILHVDISKASAMDPRNIALADGIHLIDVGLLRHIGNVFDIDELKSVEVGAAFKGTELDPVGLGKGFYHVVSMDTFGIIVYGPKPQIKFDKFFLGSLGDVEGGPARTCLQSIGCFITEESKDLWVNQMILFTVQLMESLHDEKKLKHMFLTTVGSKEDMLVDKTWLLVEAIRHGVPILHNPGLFRRVVRYLMNRVLDCKRGRIPYGDAAHRYNLMPDLTCFDFETGLVDYRKSVIPEHTVVCMDAKQGRFAMYRQPLGNAREAVVTTNIHNRRFRRYIGRERVILGPSAMTYLKQMGGGDMDDHVIGTDDLTWVEVIGKADYPVTPLPEVDAEALNLNRDEDNIYLTGGTVMVGGREVVVPRMAGRAYPTTWSMDDYFEAGSEANNPQLTIGPVDNAVRLDLMLSGIHKAHMLRDLAERIEKESDKIKRDRLIAGYHWLEDREDFQLREVGSNLESFIDFVKMRKGDENIIVSLTQQITELSSRIKVFPDCWTKLGRKVAGRLRGRIPMDRRLAQDYILAPSLVCYTLDAIESKYDDLMDKIREEEWNMVQQPPDALRELFPRDPAIVAEARSIRTLWWDWWKPFIANGTVTDPDSAYKIIMDGGKVTLTDKDEHGRNIVLAINGVNSEFNKWKNPEGEDPLLDLRLPLAVEIAFQTYRSRYVRAERSETGMRRGFADGVLWSSTIGLYYIRALKAAGLTGLYLPVKFDRYSSGLRKGIVEVKVINGLVFKKTNNFSIGYVIYDQPIDNGDYVMEDGIITVIQPAAELTESSAIVDSTYDNPVTDDLEPEV